MIPQSGRRYRGSCLTGDPVGYCSTADAGAHYTIGSPADLDPGGNFAKGSWVNL